MGRRLQSAKLAPFPRALFRCAAAFSRVAERSASNSLTPQSGTGIALVEAYDLDGAGADAHITNVSARSLSGPGAAVLTVGFAITGDTAATVLIRAVGPSLAGFGVTGELTNPQLRLYSGRGTQLSTNDDWLTTAGWAAAFSAVGAFELAGNTRDAALVVRLTPGTYTAQASGTGDEAGVALIEVYNMPNPPASSFVIQPVETMVGANPTPEGTTDVSFLGVIPQVITQASPVYPLVLRIAGITGEAVVDFVVDVNGQVVNAFVLRASDIHLGESALAAVRQWTFYPGRNTSGQVVATHMQVPIVYTFN